jgi:hypothetical protein
VQLARSSHPDLRDVPVIFELTKDQPAQQMLAFAFGVQEMGRPVVAPPGAPADRLAALREGFQATMHALEFLEDARSSGSAVRSGRGADRAAAVRDAARGHQAISGHQGTPPVAAQGAWE